MVFMTFGTGPGAGLVLDGRLYRGANDIAKESKLSEISDCTIKVPETETFKVQEYHLPVYHYLCAAVERFFFND